MTHRLANISIAYKTNIILPEKTSTEETISVFVDFLLDGLTITIVVQAQTGQFIAALSSWQQALNIYREINELYLTN